VPDLDKERPRAFPLEKSLSKLLKDCLETKMYYDVSYVRKGYDSVKNIIHLGCRSPIF